MAGYNLDGAKWGAAQPGSSGGQVSWSFATTWGSFYTYDAQISDVTYQNLVRDAFDAWEAVADIDFVEVADSSASQIRLGWDTFDGPYGIVGEATYSYTIEPAGFNTIYTAEIAFDISEPWSTNPNDVSGAVNFFVVALHEIGHAIGLGHTTDPTTIMYPSVGNQTKLTAGDIAGAQEIYGAADGVTPVPGPLNLIGTAANDTLQGSAFDDFITGGGGNDKLYGNDGNDAIFAGQGDNGADFVDGGAGNDTLGGGVGNDTVVGGTGFDVAFGGAGNDQIFMARQSGTTSDSGGTNIAWAGSGADQLTGDNTADILGGGSGNDRIQAAGGNDILYGGKNSAADSTNNDTLSGGFGNDTLYGGSGIDYLSGDSGNDIVFGGDGNDKLLGQAGNDELWGGTGNDNVTGGTGSDVFGYVGGFGNDTITDFELGVDVLDLSAPEFGFSSRADVEALASNGPGGLEIDIAGNSIVLTGLALGDFDSIDIIV